MLYYVSVNVNVYRCSRFLNYSCSSANVLHFKRMEAGVAKITRSGFVDWYTKSILLANVHSTASLLLCLNCWSVRLWQTGRESKKEHEKYFWEEKEEMQSTRGCSKHSICWQLWRSICLAMAQSSAEAQELGLPVIIIVLRIILVIIFPINWFISLKTVQGRFGWFAATGWVHLPFFLF